MNVDGKHYRTIWPSDTDSDAIEIIDQRHLPHEFVVEQLRTVDEVAVAIKDMHVRGAGLIGATAGWGMYIATRQCDVEEPEPFLREAGDKLKATRPTAVNLAWAVDRQLDAILEAGTLPEVRDIAFHTATTIADEDAEFCKRLGQHGLEFIREISERKGGETVNILTHCNAGWLAFVDYGSATAPIYAAFDAGIDVHVWVDETRPRNQGARLTAWELGQHGVPHTIIADNVGGHLMQHGQVDLVITGADRVTYTGYAANKIGTYLKALAAADNGVPFCVALPSSTFDWTMRDGVNEIPIEQRGNEEVKYARGKDATGNIADVLLTPPGSPAANFAFDVTPPRLVTALITERGVIRPVNEDTVLAMYPEKRG
ncbi:MAG: S-methyl-5-thioribose-1-phosphate isomerase [Lentisphaerae bacterium]|nr:S-methyl-5-thioribose-1-phosphate isomerase [Lentisphaerota bacterium]MBT4815941.1 S-methyl-5-thioribose-1-phosphate isomerase [Lentisphaerota bacterium]MBT5607234.1 S-methyl-5-thioribose-1-phosphate isomerase [Lentisphaerota bacterium]MBT7842640.1 S-methyl-5-thioribose-1-phosphate isomerase [Lentisphaerota bacterium]